ncbi:MAG: MauE/DoxX family redox-associated membrane protein [Syntrophobacteraceae bacterium]
MKTHWLSSRSEKLSLFLSRLLLGAIFLAAGAAKIFHPGQFSAIISHYQILPDSLLNLAAIVLPWIEAITGLLILCGLWLPGAVALADSLLVVFLLALASAAARGIDIDCGCFSLHPVASPNFAWYLARDLLFLVLGGVVTLRLLKSRSSWRAG